MARQIRSCQHDRKFVSAVLCDLCGLPSVAESRVILTGMECASVPSILAPPPSPVVMSASPDDLRAYCRGRLSPERFAEIDRWLDTLPEAEAESLLADAAVDDASSGSLREMASNNDPHLGFVSDLPAGRLRPGTAIGEGGMAVVSTAHDRVLERTVAVKVLRPRKPDEPLEQFHLREAAFRHEAALTAGLEHPAIPPIYDVGRAGGLPAFAMKRLDGETFDVVVGDGSRPLPELIEILLRVAEAVGYAHSRGVVHRDLTPQNILLAEFGAVYVLDWGLAATSGSSNGVRAGTPAWMAPEQTQAAPADPRMDVFSLGGLVLFALTRQSPASGDLSVLGNTAVPRGLSALVRRCLASVPSARYDNGGAVADELRRWLTEGVTLAQAATRWELAWMRLRRSPRVRTAITVSLAALLAGASGWLYVDLQVRHEAQLRLDAIAANTAIDRAETVAIALNEVRAIRLHLPKLAAAQALEARLQTAHELAVQREQAATIQARLDTLLQRTRTLGPWADQVQAWRTSIRDAGLTMDPEQVHEDSKRLSGHPLQTTISASLAFLWRAERERGADYHATATAQLLASAGSTPGWQALGRLLGRSQFAAHDPIFCACADSADTLSEAAPTAMALALFAPEPRLTDAARNALRERPGDFWPLIASARANLAEGHVAEAEQQALIASGAEPDSLLPQLLLGYVSLSRNDAAAFDRAIARAALTSPNEPELLVFRAISNARHGQLAEAQALLDQVAPSHLQYHLNHAVGHPMETSVRAAIAAGLHISK